MNERSFKDNYFRVAIIMVMLCFFACACSAFAEDITGSLTIKYEFKEGEDADLIKGASFSVYSLEDYSDNEDLFRLSADQIDALSKELSSTLTESVITGVTDDNGSLVIPDLDLGIYLVKQTGREDEALSFEEARPFMVSIPSEDGYDVVCYPKTVPLKTDNSEHTDNPKTGDIMSIQTMLIVLLAGTVLLIVALFLISRKGGDDPC